jgi:hypothetical protein
MDDHLVPLAGDRALRREFAVRGAGFPTSSGRGAQDESGRLREIAADPAFREALTWQKRGALATAADGLLDDGVKPEQAAPARGGRGPLLAALLLEERHDRVLRPARVGRGSRCGGRSAWAAGEPRRRRGGDGLMQSTGLHVPC